MIKHVNAPTNLDKTEEETCVSVFRSIMRAHNMLHGIGSEIAGEFELQLAEMNVIDLLGKHGPLSMGELSRTIFVAPSSATRTVKNLQLIGLVERQRSAESERVVMVSLTKAGKSLFKKSYPAILHYVKDRLTENLNKTERKALAKLLKKLAP
jgi:DNA-binding MarR family transcriptional regulator